MHARIDHLLNVRDGEPVAADIAAHIAQCPSCSAELQRLVAARAQLHALPQLEPPADSWERIQLAAADRQTPIPAWGRKAVFGIAAAMALVTFSIIAGVALRGNGSPAVANSEDQRELGSAPHTPHVAELVAQSQELEELLQKLPERPLIERVSTAATIDTIEQRIQWLDFQLSYAPDSDLTDEQTRRLWRERVELMDSLVKVRYAEAGRLSF
jgi:hypothetical protein